MKFYQDTIYRLEWPIHGTTIFLPLIQQSLAVAISCPHKQPKHRKLLTVQAFKLAR